MGAQQRNPGEEEGGSPGAGRDPARDGRREGDAAQLDAAAWEQRGDLPPRDATHVQVAGIVDAEVVPEDRAVWRPFTPASSTELNSVA